MVAELRIGQALLQDFYDFLSKSEHSNTQPTKENLSNGSQKIEKANI